ncbi:MAG: Uma2 family endonuclease, partial [Fimbriimonadales bacterium]
SYMQWREGNIAPQVVFEVASYSNTPKEWAEKLAFYDQYGVEEYYKYDPETGLWEGWLRSASGHLEPIGAMMGWVSPRLGVVFGRGESEDVGLSAPMLGRFVGFEELSERVREAVRVAEQERQLAEQERLRAEQERQLAEQERERAERLAQRLRELGIDPDA